MKNLFPETRRLLTARMIMDIVKFVTIAAIPTEFFAQLALKSRFAVGLALVILFISAWLMCPIRAKEGE